MSINLARGDLLSAGNLCIQFGPRSGPTFCRSWFGYKMFDTLIVFLKEFFEKVPFKKVSRRPKKHERLPSWVYSVYSWMHDFLMYCSKNLVYGPWCKKTCLHGICEQQRRRPACTSPQSNQRLCYSLIGKYNTCDPLKYVVDDPNLFVCICIGNSIRMLWVGIAKQVMFPMQNLY